MGRWVGATALRVVVRAGAEVRVALAGDGLGVEVGVEVVAVVVLVVLELELPAVEVPALPHAASNAANPRVERVIIGE